MKRSLPAAVVFGLWLTIYGTTEGASSVQFILPFACFMAETCQLTFVIIKRSGFGVDRVPIMR